MTSISCFLRLVYPKSSWECTYIYKIVYRSNENVNLLYEVMLIGFGGSLSPHRPSLSLFSLEHSKWGHHFAMLEVHSTYQGGTIAEA